VLATIVFLPEEDVEALADSLFVCVRARALGLR